MTDFDDFESDETRMRREHDKLRAEREQLYNQRIAELVAENQTLRDEKTKTNRAYTDLVYMQEALVNMLGPNGLEVWNGWQKDHVKRVHYSWGPDGIAMTGEERAAFILDTEKRLKEARAAGLKSDPPRTGREQVDANVLQQRHDEKFNG